MNPKKHILLTGLPGSGKTTLIKKLCEELQRKNYCVDGFYTEELRDASNLRLGFDVVALNGNREKLARISNHVQPFEMTRYKVGQYTVFPDKFEKIVTPLFGNETRILILDEIGKMELFSNQFQANVNGSFKESNKLIIATIPVSKGRPIPFIDDIRNNKDCCLFTVDRSNRNGLIEDILQEIDTILNVTK